MKIRNVTLDIVLGIRSELPRTGRPEFVLAGRSNVGKSSFINAFVNRKALARTSSTPGKTRTINYYNVNDTFYLVDLPGYGYAAAGEAEQEKWARMINRYLGSSPDIEEVIQLIDIRHAPTKQDVQMFSWIRSVTGYEPVVILTKLDKIRRSELRKNSAVIRETLGASEECVMIPFSAETKQGLTEVHALFDQVLSQEINTETADWE